MVGKGGGAEGGQSWETKRRGAVKMVGKGGGAEGGDCRYQPKLNQTYAKERGGEGGPRAGATQQACPSQQTLLLHSSPCPSPYWQW